MNYRKLLFFFLLAAASLTAMDVVRVTPVSFYQGQWHILLSHCKQHSEWNDFIGRRIPYEKSWQAASRVLREQTGGFYDLNVASYPYCPRFNYCTWNEEFVFFVPVKYAPAEKIRCEGCATNRNDYIWVLAKDVLATPRCRPMPLERQGQNIELQLGFITMFKRMWPAIERGYSEVPDYKLIHKYPSYPLIKPAPNRKCTNLSWYGIPFAISFYRKGMGHFEFSPSYPAPFKLDSKLWPTVEHYMQAMKFKDQPYVQNQIRCLASAGCAVKAGEGLDPEITGTVCSEWDLVKADFMLRANLAKFEQNPRLLCELMRTKDSVLVFDTRSNPQIDDYWGAGRNGAGRNILGQVLMQIRYELRCRDGVEMYFVEQPLANFTNGRYFAPSQVMNR